MVRTTQKQKIKNLEQKVTDLNSKNQTLTAELVAEKESQKVTINKLNAEWIGKEKVTKEQNNEKVSGFEAEVTRLNTEIARVNKEIKQKNLQIDKKETKKLATAYEEQEALYNKEAESWLKLLAIFMLALFLSAVFYIAFLSDKSLYEGLSYYLLDLILISAVWFSGSQYSNSVKLRNDYANRKTLAQSFHNILNNLSEDLEIKTKFIEKTTDVLCAPSVNTGKEPVLSKKIVKDILELIKVVK